MGKPKENVFPRGGSDQLQQMILIDQVKLVLKTAEFSKDLYESNSCGMVEILKSLIGF